MKTLKQWAAWILLMMHAAVVLPALTNARFEQDGDTAIDQVLMVSANGQTVYRLSNQMVITTGRIEDAPQPETATPVKNPYRAFIPRPNPAAISA
jgi:hypothetical protein